MFSNNFIVAIKVNGKVLREVQDVVYLPFGTEYTILLKNTSQQKAKVRISIDGQDATEGVNIIIPAGGDGELKRFIKGANMEAGNAFKFIEKTSKIEEFRGNKAEDGLITITYEFERKPKPIDYGYGWQNAVLYRDGGSNVLRSHSGTTYSSGTYDGAAYAGAAASASCDDVGEVQCSSGAVSSDWNKMSRRIQAGSTQSLYSAEVKRVRPQNDVNTSGITAPGSVVEQKFNLTSDFLTDGVSHTMTLQLKGEVGDSRKLVKEAVVVKKVQRCTMCGTNTKQTAKFCHSCGASVQLV